MKEDIDPIEEDKEEVDGLDAITYDGKDLNVWSKELSISLPKLPCNAVDMGNAVIEAVNAYGRSYNAFNTLLVLCSQAESQYKLEKFKLIDDYLAYCKKHNLKPPSRENVEIIVFNNTKNKKIRTLSERYKMYSLIKDFFEQNSKKLEKTLSAGRELLYITSASSRVENKGGI